MNDSVVMVITFFLVLLDHCPLQFVFLPALLSHVKDHERTSPHTSFVFLPHCDYPQGIARRITYQ